MVSKVDRVKLDKRKLDGSQKSKGLCGFDLHMMADQKSAADVAVVAVRCVPGVPVCFLVGLTLLGATPRLRADIWPIAVRRRRQRETPGGGTRRCSMGRAQRRFDIGKEKKRGSFSRGTGVWARGLC